MGDRHALIRALRELADAIEREDRALTFRGTSCPKEIGFAYDGVELTGYGDNPTLLDEIKVQIRGQWDRLRADAFSDMRLRIERLSATVLDLLGSEGARHV